MPERDEERLLAHDAIEIAIDCLALLRIERRGAFTSMECLSSLSTGTGIDLPDGTYRITSTATGANGPVTSTEEVSFP